MSRVCPKIITMLQQIMIWLTLSYYCEIPSSVQFCIDVICSILLSIFICKMHRASCCFIFSNLQNQGNHYPRTLKNPINMRLFLCRSATSLGVNFFFYWTILIILLKSSPCSSFLVLHHMFDFSKRATFCPTILQNPVAQFQVIRLNR